MKMSLVQSGIGSGIGQPGPLLTVLDLAVDEGQDVHLPADVLSADDLEAI